MPFIEEQTRLSIKNILLATVFTEPSETILSYAVGLARRYGSKMSLTGAASPAAICEIAGTRGVDLVVVGTQSQGVRTSDMDVAVAEILGTVPCPMLIIGPQVTPSELAKEEFDQIVYVTDYTLSSLDGLPYARALSQDYGTRLGFVHVAEGPTMGPFHFGNSRIVAFRKRLESLLGPLEVPESEFAVQEGDRVKGLVTIATKLHASLIVMSARETPDRTTSCLMWPIAMETIRRAHCPVLIARGGLTRRRSMSEPLPRARARASNEAGQKG